MSQACPDSAPDDDRDCWTTLDISEDVNVIDWLKAEIRDGLDHEFAHAVLGPMIFGCDENGTPYFEVYRSKNRTWMVRPKPEWEPTELVGLLPIPNED